MKPAMQYVLRAGVKLNADDVMMIQDDRPEAPARKRRASQAATNSDQRALDLKPTAEKPKYPWEKEFDPRVKISFRTEVGEEMHTKLVWITKNVPATSIAKIVRDAMEKEVAQILAEYAK